jgi:hypothetical protein
MLVNVLVLKWEQLRRTVIETDCRGRKEAEEIKYKVQLTIRETCDALETELT